MPRRQLARVRRAPQRIEFALCLRAQPQGHEGRMLTLAMRRCSCGSLQPLQPDRGLIGLGPQPGRSRRACVMKPLREVVRLRAHPGPAGRCSTQRRSRERAGLFRGPS